MKMNKMKKLISSLLIATMALTIITAEGAAVYAAPKIQSNVSSTAVSANLSTRSLPTSLSTLSGGESYYFNLSSTTSNKLKTGWLYIKAPGESSYTCQYKYTANGFFRYTSYKYKVPSTSGKLSYYWQVKFQDTGKTESYKINTLKVVGSGNSSSSNNSSGTSYSRETVQITKNGQVVDSFGGVNALYKKGVGNSDTDTTYSCAALVKRYYSKNYGVSVYNLLRNRTPQANKGSFARTYSPQPGDIVYHTNSSGGGHWMILKSVNSDGTYTVFEQNYKWAKSGNTYAYKNRRVSSSNVSNLKFFRYSK